MRRILSLSALVLALSGGVALADRGGARHSGGMSSRGDHGYRGDVRGNFGGRRDSGFRGYRDSNLAGRTGGHARGPTRAHRRNVYLNNGRFDFGSGVSFGWRVPTPARRHVDYRMQPAPLFENAQPMAGYLWVPGQWRWTGNQWTWSAGYYQPDPAYQDYSPGYPSAAPQSYPEDSSQGYPDGDPDGYPSSY